VVAKDNREKINIAELNKEISKTVDKTNALRADMDYIINVIESCS
jgi:type I restriction enzyme M protein